MAQAGLDGSPQAGSGNDAVDNERFRLFLTTGKWVVHDSKR